MAYYRIRNGLAGPQVDEGDLRRAWDSARQFGDQVADAYRQATGQSRPQEQPPPPPNKPQESGLGEYVPWIVGGLALWMLFGGKKS